MSQMGFVSGKDIVLGENHNTGQNRKKGFSPNTYLDCACHSSRKYADLNPCDSESRHGHYSYQIVLHSRTLQVASPPRL
jgi:hypothetical protein